MGSVTLGRAACPECGEPNAHVKQSEKCIYRWCPECGAQYYAKSERQRADLIAKTRLTAPAPPATGSEAKAAPAPAAEKPPAAAPATTTGSTATATPQPAPAPAPRRGLFGF